MDCLILRGLVVPEQKSQLLRTAQRQARTIVELSGCKLNQAQMTLAIDVYGYKSWAKLKHSIESGLLTDEMVCLLSHEHENPALLIETIKSLWPNWQSGFAKVSYLENVSSLTLIASILKIDQVDLEKIIDID